MSTLSAVTIRGGLKTQFIGQNVFYYPSIGSTNDEARALAVEGAPEGTLVIADEQTAGRGRRGRHWFALPRTSLLMSLLFRPKLRPQLAAQLTMVCSLAIVDAVREVTGLILQVKWPNDLILDGKKVGGLLTETATTRWHLNMQDSTRKFPAKPTSKTEVLASVYLDWVVVGMGINVNFPVADVPEIATTATSLADTLGKEVSRLALLQAILVEIEDKYSRLREGQFLHKAWASHLVFLGQEVEAITPQGPAKGIVEGVDPEGALLLRRADGSQIRLIVGEVISLVNDPDHSVKVQLLVTGQGSLNPFKPG
ncbi:MAG: biotin--[acetyl-CoA-carboxylase] ligase [Anaerolineae bacterium]